MKKICKSFLASLLALTVVQFAGADMTTEVKAAGNSINVVIEGNNLTIGNEFIDRTFSLENNKLSTANIINKRTDNGNTVFYPASGSEEFIIKTTKESSEPTILPAIDRTGWTANADSYQNASGPSDGPASNLLDGNLDSIWHTNYGGGTGQTAYPYNVLFTLNGQKTFESFSYTPRQNGEATNGNIKGYQLWAANTEETLDVESEQWIKIAEGNFKYDGVNPIYVNLDEACSANQLKLVATSANNGQSFAGGAEFNLHEEKAPVAVDDGRTFKSSDLTLSGAPVVSETTATINEVAKTGKKVTFNFEPYTYKGVEYTISQNIVMYEGDHFMRKYLEISVPNDKKADAVIDYIDLESLNVNDTDATWTIPTDAGGVVSMEAFRANLGQPIYIQGMFFGCEFPVADTQIVDGNGYMRYYTGKSFERLEADNQLTSDTNTAKYVTWQTVAGAARSTENEVIQSDFFDYIDSIATPSEFRIQYNSWFDNMMLIDDDNILESFIEVDKELNATEVRPMDSYVVDDGWNNYNNSGVVDAARSGTTLNQSGFWEFNSKFPNGLTTSSELVEKFGSNFGVWIGPRGGYNFYGTLADILTKSGKGSKAGGSVDVADRVYVKNFEEMAVNWQKEYGVNYWKWDGYADDAQFNHWQATDGVPGYANNHMTGGYKSMYHVTDLWESWIDLFEKVRQSEKEDDINKLWISLTCYVNPSPWYLQWANSVWMQCVADRGESGSISGKMDKMLTYRDAMYYDFITQHEFQFPLKNIYNHDPIYGTEGTGINVNSMTSEEFKNYLYMMGTRGTGFWELYYSDSIMTDEKYEVNAEFLEWAEENFNKLENAKIIGGNPALGVKLNSGPWDVGSGGDAYGFSCFDGEEGFISMRNSDVSAKTLTFTLDRNIGVAESASGKTMYRTSIHNYNTPDGADDEYKTLSYGDTVSITLQPGEVRIWEVSTTQDTTAPEFTRAYTDGNKEITVKFNEKVKGNLLTVEGAKVSKISKSEDNITYHITLASALKDGQEVKVIAKDITDMAGNTLVKNTFTTTYHDGNNVVSSKAQDIDGSKNISTADRSLNSNNGFTVSANVITTSKGQVVAQENGYELGITNEGNAYFTLNGATAVSEEVVNDGNEHAITGVKENNGILKLYVDGTLAGSSYNAENRFFNIKAGNTVLGSAGFVGNVAVQVYDTAYGYDVVKELVTPSEERKPLDTTGMNVTATGGTSEGSATNIFDNDPTTFWTSNEVVDGIKEGNPNLTIDLGNAYVIDRFDYTKRFYNGPENMWKCTGNLREYVLEVSVDGVTWTKVSEGKTFDDESYTEKGDGGTTVITFDAIEARYVRISGTASYHWQDTNVNKYMTVADVNIYGEEAKAENLALNKEIAAKWSADNSNAGNSTERPVDMAVDGVKDNTTGNYAEFGSDGSDASSYLEVDLGTVNDVEGINLFRYWADGRTYKGTVIALSETADFANPIIVYNSDKENKHGLGAGSDDTYEETSAGKTITLAERTKARYVRVYMQGSDRGNTNHLVELEVMGYKDKEEVETVDISALLERLEVLNEVDLTNVTTNSKAAFNTLVKTGYDLVATGADTQAQVDEMIESLKDAEALLVDTADLKEAIKNAEAAVKTSTTSSAVEMNKVITEAKELLKNGTVETIKDMIDSLKETEKLLVTRGDTKALADLIDSYASLKESEYTVDSWAEFKAALDAAKAIVADNSDSSQTDVDTAKEALKATKEALKEASVVPEVDKTALVEAIKTAKDVNKDEFTTTSYNELMSVLARAEEFNKSDTVTQEQVNKVAKDLTKAIDSLVKRAETSVAEKVIADLDSEKLEESAYTASSWKAYMSARKALEAAIADNSDVDATQMNALIEAVNAAKENLKKAPVVYDKTKLEDLYNANKDKKNDGYTNASWNKFQNALEAAKAIINNPNATETQIINAIDQLNSAIDGLTKGKASSTDTGDTTNTSGFIVLLLLSGVALAFASKRKFSK